MQRVLPPVALVMAWFAMVAAHLWLPLGTAIPSPWNFIGVPMLAAGLAIAVVGALVTRQCV